jgi:hypothetical protein
MTKLDNESLDGKMDWFYPHQINPVFDLKFKEGIKLGELSLIIARDHCGKSDLAAIERKKLYNTLFGKYAE